MSKLIEMLKDVYPHCKGDVVRVEADELKHLDAKSDENGPAYKDLSVVDRAEAAQEAEVVEPDHAGEEPEVQEAVEAEGKKGKKA